MIERISIVFLILTFIAEVIGTIGGFGSSVFFVPIANIYFDFHSVLGLTAIFHVASNLSKISLFRQGVNKRLIFFIGLPSVLFVVIGAVLSKWVQPFLLEVFLGLFLIGLSLLFLIKKDLVITAGKKESIIGGSLSGLAAGLLGTGGAIRGITMAAFNLEKSTFIATSAFIDFAIDSTRTVVYYFNGYIHSHDMIYVPFLIGIGWIGTYVGKLILNHIPQERFKKLTLLLILVIGVMTLLQFWINL